jgi:hypothetical protein
MTRASISGEGNLEDICPDGSGVPSCGQANRDGDDNAGGGDSVGGAGERCDNM